MTSDDDPVRFVALVVGALALVFVALSAAVQFGSGNALSVLTVPLVLLVPVVAGAVYYHVRHR